MSAKFPTGQLVATPHLQKLVPFYGDGRHIRSDTGPVGDVAEALERHLHGNWGDVCAHDKKVNDEALLNGERLLSAYTSTTGVKFWIITEADRSVTTVLLPEDY